ncbi:GNAT family N-acetyltransferase [Anatilimnocola floriformis]|uniref:GNAT family N-acetyltransferase n=1 Tax=Anatilimnocola floriformis TaxID=2948575 RepID=UPI0020C3CF82|nr:GNAT family N-acetyltransferase [Anatilimnocola floriformis]
MSIRIRQASVADAAPLLELFKDTIRRVNCRDYAPDQIAAWTSEILPEVWAARLMSRWCAVAANDAEQPIGFGDLEANGHLDRFFVHADYQGRGVGTALMTAIFARATKQQHARIFSEVSITARPFFLNHGFRVITDQLVFSRGAAFLNYRMERWL